MRMDPQTRTGWLQALEKQGEFSPEAHHSRGEAAGYQAMIAASTGGVPNLTQVLKDGGKAFKGDPKALQGFYAGVEIHRKMFPSSQPISAKDQITIVRNAREGFAALPEVKDFKKVVTAYEKVKSSAESQTAAGDMALVFAYMKMLDPGSTVRESEFENAAATTGLPGKFINAVRNAKNGIILNPEQRADFLNEARSALLAHKKSVIPSINQYGNLAKDIGASRNSIIPEGLFDIDSDTQPGKKKHPGLGGGDNIVPLGATEEQLNAELEKLREGQ